MREDLTNFSANIYLPPDVAINRSTSTSSDGQNIHAWLYLGQRAQLTLWSQHPEALRKLAAEAAALADELEQAQEACRDAAVRAAIRRLHLNEADLPEEP